MKKSLFAIAAVTAFAGAAQAQSSVTVYGLLDVGFTGGSVTNTTATGVGNTASSAARISNNMESGSRIGFRGTEDLGGGTSAQFVAEMGFQPAGNSGNNPAGQVAATQALVGGNAPAIGAFTGQGSTFWSPDIRQAYVGITQKGAGEVRIGTQNTLNWEQAGSNTTGQLAQVLGSMLAPTTAGVSLVGTNAASLAAFANRTNNTITVRSVPMSGLTLKAGYNQSNQSDNTGVNDQSGYQVAAQYIAGKANLQASYAGFTSQNSTANIIGWGSAIQGNAAKDNQMLITASYDFGILRAYAGYVDRRIVSQANSNDTLSRTAYEIGVRSFITSKVEGWASGGMGKLNAQGVGGNTANLTGYQVGSNYWLSKRTNLYGIVGANNVAATSANAGIVNGVATNKSDAFQYAVGVRHTF